MKIRITCLQCTEINWKGLKQVRFGENTQFFLYYITLGRIIEVIGQMCDTERVKILNKICLTY